jgi:hypothetical protein
MSIGAFDSWMPRHSVELLTAAKALFILESFFAYSYTQLCAIPLVLSTAGQHKASWDNKRGGFFQEGGGIERRRE